MSINRFKKIKRFFHFNNNEIQDATADNRDPLFKVRPIINKLLERFQAVPKTTSIGRTSLRHETPQLTQKLFIK